jgi:pimeloyl-ACP methyl ester carboxylesterase
MPEAQSEGVRIDYADLGKGEPALLLLPGWCATRSAFAKMIDLCAAHRRVLALDWRGHGSSGAPTADFGTPALVEDALAVINASGVTQVAPVALSHAGWVGIELRRRLAELVPKLALIDWIVLDLPTPFLSVLRALQDPIHWEETRKNLFSAWLQGISNPELSSFVLNDMGAFGFDMWARAGREIMAAYTQHGNPLRTLEALAPAVPTLHIYAQPSDPVYWQAQQSFSASHPWFTARRVNALSHFPMFEEPEEMAQEIGRFLSAS